MSSSSISFLVSTDHLLLFFFSLRHRLVQIVMWQFAHTYSAIMGFSVLYGMFGSMWLRSVQSPRLLSLFRPRRGVDSTPLLPFSSLLPVVTAQLFGVHDLATLTGFAVLVNSPGEQAAFLLLSFLRRVSFSTFPIADR